MKKSVVFDYAKVIIYSLVLSVLILTFVIKTVSVNGPSMMNTLQNGDRVIVTNYYKNLYQPKQGDIIAVSPEGIDDDESNIEGATDKFDVPIIKRIIAVGGQTVGIDTENGDVYVDGKIIDETYIFGETAWGIEWEIPDVIPDGQYFVMGDNRPVSRDSRSSYIGLISNEQIIGKAQFVIFPFNEAKYLY